MNAPQKKPTAAKSLGEQIEETDRAANQNMRVWNAVCRTDPKHTKRVNQRGGFTAIDAQYQIMEATRQFGPVGEGWGYSVGEYNIVGNMIVVPVTLWHGKRDNTFGPILGCAEMLGQRPDRDAPKKAITDALTKGLSQLGFNADVFLGLFDDNKYVEQVTAEFHPPKNPDGGDATVPRGEGDMSDSALRGCVKALVHSLHGCGTVQDLDELMEMSETVATIEQCKRRFPNWWSTGAGMPAEFTPLKRIIEQTHAGLKTLAEEHR